MQSLWKHQAEAIGHLLPLNAGALWAGLGCGKTRIALELIRERQVRRTLVLAPKAVVGQWATQAARWLPDAPVLALDHASVRQRIGRLEAFGDGIVALNYDAVILGAMPHALNAWGPAMLVLDEAHKLKKPGGKRSRAIAGLAARIPYRLGMSGTPLAHSPLDAYAVYRALAPTIFGPSYVAFKRRYTEPCRWGQHQGMEIGRGGVLTPYRFVRLDDLHEHMMSIAYQVETRDVLDLPPELDAVRTVELEPETARLYRRLDKEFTAEVKGGRVTAANALVKLLRLQEITGGSVHTEDGMELVDSTKRKELISWLEDLPPEEPCVVFCRFVADLAVSRDTAATAGRRYYELSGRSSEKDKWLADSGGAVLGVQMQAGGAGVDGLQRACFACFYSLGYSLADYQQARARLMRAGQTRSVHFSHLVASGTVDEEVYAALERREEVVERVLQRRGR